MSEFIPNLFDGLPEVPEGDPDTTMLSGLRRVIQKLNEELSFVRGLAGATRNIEAIEQKITEVKATTYEIEKQQVGIVNGARLSELKLEESDAAMKSFGERVTTVESGAWQTGRGRQEKDDLQGHPKDLPKWSGSTPFF